MRRIAKELAALSNDAPEGITIHVNEADMTDVQATIIGPGGSVGGNFLPFLHLLSLYPMLSCDSVTHTHTHTISLSCVCVCVCVCVYVCAGSLSLYLLAECCVVGRVSARGSFSL